MSGGRCLDENVFSCPPRLGLSFACSWLAPSTMTTICFKFRRKNPPPTSAICIYTSLSRFVSPLSLSIFLFISFIMSVFLTLSLNSFFLSFVLSFSIPIYLYFLCHCVLVFFSISSSLSLFFYLFVFLNSLSKFFPSFELMTSRESTPLTTRPGLSPVCLSFLFNSGSLVILT